MDKFWLKSYPKDVPEEIDPKQYAHLDDFFDLKCMQYADKEAYSSFGSKLTYRQTQQYVLQFAAFLQQQLQMKQGDRLALMMPNCLQYPIAMFAGLKAGLTIVNVNPLYTVPELIHQINDSGAKTIVVLANMAKTVAQALVEMSGVENVIVTQLGDLFAGMKSWMFNFIIKYIKRMIPEYDIEHVMEFRHCLEQGAQLQLMPVDIKPDDIAFLQYTGGTTGVAKGAMLSHKNIVANILQCRSWVGPVLREGHEIIITALPLYHIFSLTANCLVFFDVGGLNVLITNPREITTFVKEMAKHRFTAITGVNTLFNALLENEDFAQLDFSELHICLAGGMAMQKSVADAWQKVTGKVICEGYGLTEASPVVTINPIDLSQFNGSIGLPVPSTEIAIMGEQNETLAIDEVGEFCVRGPQVMQGYWQNQKVTEQVINQEGWLRTGDMAKVDKAGFVYIVDRKKDMIVVSGFNVYPNEVEAVIAQMPQVLEVAVVGVPDAHSGEEVKAFIVKKDPGLTEKMVIAHCRKNLTAYKCPKFVEFRDDLPKTNVGKILRRELKQE